MQLMFSHDDRWTKQLKQIVASKSTTATRSAALSTRNYSMTHIAFYDRFDDFSEQTAMECDPSNLTRPNLTAFCETNSVN